MPNSERTVIRNGSKVASHVRRRATRRTTPDNTISMENRRPMSADVRTAANYAHNYLGMRPKLQPTHMRRVGGGYKSDRKSEAEMMEEIEALYDELDRERKEKEKLRADKAKAEQVAATYQVQHASSQELANAVASSAEQIRGLQQSLHQSQAALAERGMSLDAALERVASLEAEKHAKGASAASALREAEAARRDAGAAEACAAEREHQLEVLIAALKERTSEVERLTADLKVTQQKYTLATSYADEQAGLHAKALDEAAARASEAERSLRQTLSHEERRHESEKGALRAELERSNARGSSQSALCDSLRDELAELKAQLKRAQGEHEQQLKEERQDARSALEAERGEWQSSLSASKSELEAVRREASEGRGEAREEIARLGRELHEARREKGEAARSAQAETRQKVGEAERELERKVALLAEAERQAERAREKHQEEARLVAEREAGLHERIQLLETDCLTHGEVIRLEREERDGEARKGKEAKAKVERLERAVDELRECAKAAEARAVQAEGTAAKSEERVGRAEAQAKEERSGAQQTPRPWSEHPHPSPLRKSWT